MDNDDFERAVPEKTAEVMPKRVTLSLELRTEMRVPTCLSSEDTTDATDWWERSYSSYILHPSPHTHTQVHLPFLYPLPKFPSTIKTLQGLEYQLLVLFVVLKLPHSINNAISGQKYLPTFCA